MAEPPLPTGDDEEALIKAAVKGMKLIKYGRRGLPHRRAIKVTMSHDALLSGWTKKSNLYHCISHSCIQMDMICCTVSAAFTNELLVWLKDIKEIRRGQTTPVFLRWKDPKKENRSFSIFYKDEDGTER